MNRRAFLRASALTAAGLYVAPDLLAEPRRRIFPVGIDLKTPAPPSRTMRIRGIDMHGAPVEFEVPMARLWGNYYRGVVPDGNVVASAVDIVDEAGRVSSRLMVSAAQLLHIRAAEMNTYEVWT